MKTASLVLVVCSLTLWVACGSKGGGSASFSSAASLSSLQVTPAAGSIATGATQQFTATGKFSDGSSKDVTSSVQWSSTAATVASVSSNGLATGVAAGVVTVTAQSGTVKGTASLTITSVLQQPSLVSLQVMPSNVSIAVAATQQFTVKGTFSDNSTKDMTSSVTWSSSDSTFATINGAGLATGVAVGVLTVTAQSGSVQGTANLTVTNAAANLASLTLSPLASSIPVNTTQQFTATGSYSDGSSRDLTALVSWSSSATANRDARQRHTKHHPYDHHPDHHCHFHHARWPHARRWHQPAIHSDSDIQRRVHSGSRHWRNLELVIGSDRHR